MSIEAMKLALESMGWTDEWRPENLAENAITALRQAIEQAEQAQPVDADNSQLMTHDDWDKLQDQCEEMVSHNFRAAVLAKIKEKQAEQAHWVGVSDERLMEIPEFTKHIVEDAADWSEWVCPDPESYLMKCCDCGLVHEAQFGVVRYKSETEREDCDKVDDPNLQAVFRMRRHEAWKPEDTAHRAGGLPMEKEPVGEVLNERGDVDWISFVPTSGTSLYTTPPQRKPLTDEEIDNATRKQVDALLDHIYEFGTAAEGIDFRVRSIARAIEAKIKENK